MPHGMSYSKSAVDITGVENSKFQMKETLSLENKEGDISPKKSIITIS